jgi:hypothetical protein
MRERTPAGERHDHSSSFEARKKEFRLGYVRWAELGIFFGVSQL